MSKKSVIFVFILLSFFFVSYVSQQNKKLSGPLDGNVYQVELFKEGKDKKYEDDELRFNAGCKFKSSLFADWLFDKPAVYNWTVDSANPEIKVYAFSARLSNPSEEVMNWSGTVKGEEIEGTAQKANKKGRIQQIFIFKGKMKKKKKA